MHAGFAIASLIVASAWAGMTLAQAAPPDEFAARSEITQAGNLIGRRVETREGEELGKIQDFAIDMDTGRIVYVVVSVGSFLIEDSLIAVDPDALRPASAEDGPLILQSDDRSLEAARRFSEDDWPLKADVLPVITNAVASDDARGEGDQATADERASSGTATISDGSKTATLSAGEKSIRIDEPPAPAAGPPSDFDSLDTNGNGALDRVEIAHELTPQDSYPELDENGNGVIEASEYETLVQQHQDEGE